MLALCFVFVLCTLLCHVPRVQDAQRPERRLLCLAATLSYSSPIRCKTVANEGKRPGTGTRGPLCSTSNDMEWSHSAGLGTERTPSRRRKSTIGRKEEEQQEQASGQAAGMQPAQVQARPGQLWPEQAGQKEQQAQTDNRQTGPHAETRGWNTHRMNKRRKSRHTQKVKHSSW